VWRRGAAKTVVDRELPVQGGCTGAGGARRRWTPALAIEPVERDRHAVALFTQSSPTKAPGKAHGRCRLEGRLDGRRTRPRHATRSSTNSSRTPLRHRTVLASARSFATWRCGRSARPRPRPEIVLWSTCVFVPRMRSSIRQQRAATRSRRVRLQWRSLSITPSTLFTADKRGEGWFRSQDFVDQLWCQKAKGAVLDSYGLLPRRARPRQRRRPLALETSLIAVGARLG